MFSRKPKETTTEEAGNQSAPGWKLFGRVPPKEVPQKDPSLICEEYKVKAAHVAPPSGAVVKKSDVEVSSTTALILEQRPK